MQQQQQQQQHQMQGRLQVTRQRPSMLVCKYKSNGQGLICVWSFICRRAEHMQCPESKAQQQEMLTNTQTATDY
jgi:hypothetical protein